MRALLLAAALLVPAASARADAPAASATAPADWRREGLSDAQRGALADSGYRLQDDGAVLSPRSGAPLGDPELQAALAELGFGAEQSALQRLSLLAAKGTLSAADRVQLDALKGMLPDDAAKALAAGAPASDLRRIAEGDLAEIADFFDAARTPSRRAADAAPVVLGDPGSRTPVAYFAPAQKTLGDGLRAAAAHALGADPVGRAVLARLNGPNGKPDLPAIVVEDAPDGAAADYNYRRRALVIDAATLRDSIVGGAPASSRSALRARLAAPAALVAYASANPAALNAFAAQNDALLAHELTHAWQDRRDPVMQEMARGALPLALIVDDEVEAWTVKNLYIASRMKRDPRAAIDPHELADFSDMAAAPDQWRAELKRRYGSVVVNAMDLDTMAALQRDQLARTKSRAVSTAAEQADKSLDLLMQTRAERELQSARGAERARLAALRARSVRTAAAAPRLLALHFLAAADDAPNPVEVSADLQRAEEFAQKAGDAALQARIGRRRAKTTP